MPVLCNESSIIATYQSNHTLDDLGEGGESHLHDNYLPEDINSLLRVNRENGKHQAARLKIIRTHFSGVNINLEPFLDMGLKMLPHAVAWMGGDDGTDDVERSWDEGFDLL